MILGRSHIKLGTLSEYLDGRLPAGVNARTERHLAACHRCVGELESLQYAVGLLRQAPQAQPRRSFTLAAPPAPAQAPPVRPVFRPQWAYGAAASMTVLLFAAVLTADLSGTLEPDIPPSRASDQATEPATKAAPTSQPQDEEQNAASLAAGESGVEDLSQLEPGPDLMMRREPAEGAVAAEAKLAPSDLETAEDDEVRAAAAILSPAVEAPGEPVSEAATDSAAFEVESAKETPPPQVTQPLAAPAGDDGGTHVGWRVLEGLSGAAAVVLAVAVFWRWRRRSGTA